jgi:hypothetical protein
VVIEADRWLHQDSDRRDKMDWKDLGSKIAASAPILGGIIGGPAGGAAGAGIKALAGMFGLTETATPDEIDKAISSDPNLVMKLKMAEMDFKVQMREKDIDEIRVEMLPYLEGLKVKTIPWVDALHKMGRQIANYYVTTIVFVLLMTSHVITPEAALLLSGGNLAYQLIKGKGQK